MPNLPEDLQPRSAEALGERSEIRYVYMTFETDLPLANTTARSSGASAVEAPPGPDLDEYTNPQKWPASRKNLTLAVSCVATFMTAYSAGAYAPPAGRMAAQFHASELAIEVGITMFCVGFAIAPMVLAPFSEINGRYPVFAVSGVVFLAAQAGCALVQDLGGMLALRLFVGIGGSVFSTMVGGVIADIYAKRDRNTPMALFAGAALLGTGAGPLVAAAITQQSGSSNKWRWVFWHQAIMNGLLIAVLVIFFKESRGSVILSRRAKVVNKWYEQLEAAGFYGVWMTEGPEPTLNDEKSLPPNDPTPGDIMDEKRTAETTSPDPSSTLQRVRWVVKEDEDRASLARMISVSVYRPFHLLVTEPVVLSFSVWVSFAWAVLYLTFGSIPLVFSAVYGWDIQSTGYVFISMMAGAVLATIQCIALEKLLDHPQWRVSAATCNSTSADSSSTSSSSSAPAQPGSGSSRFWAVMRRRFPAESSESRIYFTCFTAILLPVGLFIFGLSAKSNLSWIGPIIGIALATMGIYSIYLATFNYLADVYGQYASSALAAQSCCRNLLGGVFPLVMSALFTNLGPARAGGLLGGIACALTFVPWVLTFYGPVIRARSKFAVVRTHTLSNLLT